MNSIPKSPNLPLFCKFSYFVMFQCVCAIAVSSLFISFYHMNANIELPQWVKVRSPMETVVFGVWCLVFGIWCLVFGVQCTVFGVRPVWGLGFEVWSLFQSLDLQMKSFFGKKKNIERIWIKTYLGGRVGGRWKNRSDLIQAQSKLCLGRLDPGHWWTRVQCTLFLNCYFGLLNS